MATNFEFYKNEILEISGNKMEIAVVNNRPVPCEEVDCTACDFRDGCGEWDVVAWLYAEHIEQPKLTKRERAFCEAVQTGWIAMDEDNALYWYSDTPEKHNEAWGGRHYTKISYMNLGFSFIKWEDEKPWAVEDLLKLEVQEDA